MQLAVRSEKQHFTHASPGYLLAVLIAAGVAAFGAFTWADKQMQTGLGITGMNAPTYWGAYIVNFVFFVGLSAGGIIVSGLVHAFKVERFRAVARIAEIVSIICILMAAVFITLDIGRPDRIWHLARYGRWQSPLIWDVFIVNAYLAMALALGYFSTRADIVRCMRTIPSRARLYKLLALGYTNDSPEALRRDEIILRVLAFISIPTAVMLHSVTAWIMGLAKATPGWHTALLAPVFVGSALASGLALVTCISFLGRHLLKAEVSDRTIANLGRLIVIALPVLGYLLFSEMITVTYAQETSPSAFFDELISGDYALFFWFDLMVGLVAPLLMLAYVLWIARPSTERAPATERAPMLLRRTVWGTASTVAIAVVAVALVTLSFSVDRSKEASLSPSDFSFGGTPFAIALSGLAAGLFVLLVPRLSRSSAVALASALVVAGVLAERINIVLAPQATRFSANPDETFALPYTVAGYRPTFEEMSIVVGVYGLGVLGFLVFSKIFPLTEIEEEAPAPAQQFSGWEEPNAQ